MTTPIPSEFTGFVRDTGVRAFDRLTTRAKELDPPLRNFIRSWSKLSDRDKVKLFDELIAAVRAPETEEQEQQPAPPPPPRSRQKQAVKRYDPEEVAATLPRKPRAKPKPAASRKTKKKSE
ncbi:MAG TPA: hypothetical protein VFT12_06495 [Thermoanaerobaculia bacterium]|nr:hypothetical protein [Thermoanaerobaculia bacterium]